MPVAMGAGTFGVFYGLALVARHIPVLNRAIGIILNYAHHGPNSFGGAITSSENLRVPIA